MRNLGLKEEDDLSTRRIAGTLIGTYPGLTLLVRRGGTFHPR